ncbi:MAG: hypothetical protein WC603_03630 [Candidatus Paceibacterota bacterium]|jgi:hypothetical protein
MTPTWIKWLWIGLILIIVIPLLIWGIRSINDNNNPKKSGDSGKNNRGTGYVQIEDPAPHDTTYFLEKGKVFLVDVPSDYTSSCSSGGKKYYKRPQNGKWEVRGDGGNHRDRYTSFFELKFYEEEIIVTVEFNKIVK